MKIKAIVVAALTLISSAHATTGLPYPIQQCVDEAPYGFPVSKNPTLRKICRLGYVVGYDGQAKIPNWVSYTLSPVEAVGCLNRTAGFEVDKSIPINETATQADYSNSGYDIGHMAPDGDMRWSTEAEDESSIFSNAAPQLPGFNRGIWKKFEDMVRGWAVSRKHELLIYVGPIYSNADASIGPHNVTVPHAFFKIVLDTTTNETFGIMLNNSESKQTISTVSLASIQRATGLTFPLPKQYRETKMWTVDIKNVSSTKAQVCK